MRLMKKLTLLVVGLVALVAVTYAITTAAVNRYNVHQKQKQAQAVQMVTKAQADQEVADVKQSAASEYVSLQASYNNAVTECQKGVTAYAKLATLTKVLPAAPACPAPAK